MLTLPQAVLMTLAAVTANAWMVHSTSQSWMFTVLAGAVTLIVLGAVARLVLKWQVAPVAQHE